MAKKSPPRKAKKPASKVTQRKPKTIGKPHLVPPAKPPEQTGASESDQTADRFPIVGVGASAGGLEAFTQLLKALPEDTGMGFVLVQHMDPSHESVLATLLQRSTKMPIREALDGITVEPNRIYSCPPNALMTISDGVLSLTTRGPRSFKDFPIDQFFISLADDLKNRAIGVILSGTASDGTRGLLAIKGEGGITFAQDSESAQFSGMPTSAVASGCVDFTLPPAEIAKELSQINRHPYLKRPGVREQEPQPEPGEIGISKIIRLLRAGTGVDFGLYKPAMVGRRIARRMALHKMETPEQYFQFLQKNRGELTALHEDIFIHVTGFFRDPESLGALQRRVLANLTLDKMFPRTIRIWVPGCSTGEEVYSIGMLLFEHLGERRSGATIQIFGTDISEQAVQRARAGIYAASSMIDVSPDRQRRFFARIEGNYQITKALRDVCIFARHDLSKDPPFSRMDVISCRNVLIYMGAVLQKKVIEGFHYALNPRGHLLLGRSESLSAYAGLFTVEDGKHKILIRRPIASPLHVPMGKVERAENGPAPALISSATFVSDLRREAEKVLLDKYAPAALVVASDLQIIHFQGNTGPYLSPASGEPSFHLLRMIRPELLVHVRTAIRQAKREATAVRMEGIRYQHNGETSLVDIEVSLLKGRPGKEFDYLVVFREREQSPSAVTAVKAEATERSKGMAARKDRELELLREQLQAMAQDHEAADEEMRSLNEEILSSNEELQSTNEELETAKEELESSNEELTTLNDELQNRNADLSQTSDDLNNLLTAVNIPVLILDTELHIRRFTPSAGQAWNLIATDLGRPLSDIAPTLQGVNLLDLGAEVLARGQAQDLEVQDALGQWYALRLCPYRSSSERIEGVVIALIDIDFAKRTSEEALAARRRSEELEAHLALIGEGLGVGVWEYDVATGETRGSKRWSALFGVPQDRPISRSDWLARVHPEDHQVLLSELNRLLQGGRAVNREHRVVMADGKTRWLNFRAELMRSDHGSPAKIHGVSIDVTDRVRQDRERQALSFRIASAQGAERQRIARELHDGLIQDLAALAVDLGRRASAGPASAESLKEDYQALQSRVVKAAEAARHVAYELHPSELDDLGLGKALRQYCEQFGRDQGIKIDYTNENVPEKLKREIAAAIYKVAQEGLWNIAKHSKAKKAIVALEAADGAIRLRIEDKGDGFPMSRLDSGDRMGVAGMRERIELLNGKFLIKSEPGKGTRITAEVPVIGNDDYTDQGSAVTCRRSFHHAGRHA